MTTARPDIRLPPDLDDAHERALIGEVLDLCGFGGLRHAVDYGCGRGRWIWPLAARSEAVTGIDCEQSYLDTIAAIAQANRRTLQLIAAPTLRPLADASVDGIISIGTLPVVRAGELWHDFFDQAARVLRPQGRILLNTFAPALVTDRLARFDAFRYVRSHGLRFALDRELGDMIHGMRALRASIEPGGRYYATRASAVERLIASKGFRVVMRTDDLMRGSRVGSLPAYPNNRKPPHYDWWLVTR